MLSEKRLTLPTLLELRQRWEIFSTRRWQPAIPWAKLLPIRARP
jgi:hypothetical protein